MSNLWWIRLKYLLTPAPFMSGRCNRSLFGADSGRWAAGYDSRCLLVVIDLFFACLLFFLFFYLLSGVLV
jgi:hypothetical protein